MKPRTQAILIGFLLVLLVCQPMICPVTNYLMLPVGRLVWFGVAAYTALKVSPVIGLLVAILGLQAMSKFYVVEHMALSASNCECPPGYTFADDVKKCKNKDDKFVFPTACRCDSGYAYNIKTGLCDQNSVMSSPIPAVAPAPAGTEEVPPTVQVAPPAATSVSGKRIELSPEEKNAVLGKEPAVPAETTSSTAAPAE
jgi:hypothetical protein